MIPEPICRLLTAYVNGELDARQKKDIQEILHRSPEAMALVQRLQKDAERLRALLQAQNGNFDGADRRHRN